MTTTAFNTLGENLVGGHLVIDADTDFGPQSAVSVAVRFKAEASGRNAMVEVGMARLNTRTVSRNPRRFVLAEDAKTAVGKPEPGRTLATWTAKPVVEPVKLLTQQTKIKLEAGRYYWLIAQSSARNDAADLWLWAGGPGKLVFSGIFHELRPGRSWAMVRGQLPAMRVTVTT